MKGNPVAKFMNRVNRPSVHKDANKASQEPLEIESEGCYICGSPKVIQNSLEQICKQCKESRNDQ